MLIDKTKYCTDHGVKAHKVSNWMQRHWTKGLHYFVIGRTTMIDTEEVERWIRQNTPEEFTNMATICELESGTKEKLPTKRRFRATHSQKVTFGGWQNSAQS